jgi:hypothetical protein
VAVAKYVFLKRRPARSAKRSIPVAEGAMLTKQSFAGFDIGFRATRILNDLE